MIVSFTKPELLQKSGELSFNVVRISNPTDSAIRFKPIIEVPAGWAVFSTSLIDTVVQPHDTISLPFRIRMSDRASSEIRHEIIFRAFSTRNKLMLEKSFFINTEPFHNWEVSVLEKRVFFYPHNNLAAFHILVENRGNTPETINLRLKPDMKLNLVTADDWNAGVDVILPPYHDTLLTFSVTYVYAEDRIFDVGRVQIFGASQDKQVIRAVLVEKYSDLYSPFEIDKNLPHQAEAGIRTFSNNQDFLPFFKARGTATFKNMSRFQYNFNYYSRTGREDLESNTYYQFLYNWKSLQLGLGAVSSQLGRNLYSRHAAMISNALQLSPTFGMEIFVSQSYLSPKTSAALGYTFQKKKILLNGSFAYDFDNEREVNTGSALFSTNQIPVFKNHDISLNLYGYLENHFTLYPYQLMGYAWDVSYYGRIGKVVGIQITNNYGSPDIPGPQMGLLTFSGGVQLYLTEDRKSYLSAGYTNSRREYSLFNEEGIRLPEINLYDQYADLKYHSHKNPDFTWELGPSVEKYESFRPSYAPDGYDVYYSSNKIRFEFKTLAWHNLMINIKTGFCNIDYREAEEIQELRYDFHLLGGYGRNGYGLAFNYDYGPMVNTGLYQFAGDARNNSFNIGPTMMQSYLKGRLSVNVFSSIGYRFDLNYGSININPKIEAFMLRDWYVVVSGTYSFIQQEYHGHMGRNSNYYLEVSIKKRWGKSDINKWQNNTRSLKIVLFKDDNGNGLKEDNEEGVPFVKTSLKLTNAASQDFSSHFPVDITLLSNEAGIVIYNRLPVGFYDLKVTPLTDMREYFYVNQSAEKIELTKTTTYFIAFQKANKITGKINVQRDRFIREGEEHLELANIKVTAYNKGGNSYSTFTNEKGEFVIFAPGNTTYFVRMENIFGSRFKIARNDISVTVGESPVNLVDFNIVEINRQVKFKEARPVIPDSLQQGPLKIKVLHGKFYENRSDTAVDKNAAPEFHIREIPAEEQLMIPGNYYVVLSDSTTREEAMKVYRIVEENGINAYLGLDARTEKYYVFTNYYKQQGDARKEMEKLKKGGIKIAEILKLE